MGFLKVCLSSLSEEDCCASINISLVLLVCFAYEAKHCDSDAHSLNGRLGQIRFRKLSNAWAVQNEQSEHFDTIGCDKLADTRIGCGGCACYLCRFRFIPQEIYLTYCWCDSHQWCVFRHWQVCTPAFYPVGCKSCTLIPALNACASVAGVLH
jgi:hypothetical protein